MAKIRNSNPKQSGGGYERLVTMTTSVTGKGQQYFINKFLGDAK